mgnify:CR=1 FL=1|tara:strand:- start:357 stop:824 length:468 start_codon:yes stop_codon:yes gene_type:complete
MIIQRPEEFDVQGYLNACYSTQFLERQGGTHKINSFGMAYLKNKDENTRKPLKKIIDEWDIHEEMKKIFGDMNEMYLGSFYQRYLSVSFYEEREEFKRNYASFIKICRENSIGLMDIFFLTGVYLKERALEKGILEWKTITDGTDEVLFYNRNCD